MIVKGMSDSEIIKELKSIDAIIKSRISGYLKKFGMKLKSKAYKNNDILGVEEYEINDNRVLVCFQKLVFTDKLSDLGISHIVITKDNGAFLSNKSVQGNFFFHHFTNHAIDRMWQRLGLTVEDFFVNEFVIEADTTFHLTKYDKYGYDDYTYIMSIGRCFFIVCQYNNKIVVKTSLDRDSLYANQMRLCIDSARCAREYTDKIYERDVNHFKEIGYKKTSDIIRAMRA